MAVNRLGPACPACGTLCTDVLQTARTKEGHFFRRRECPSCKHRFQTIQPRELIHDGNCAKWKNRAVSIDWYKVKNLAAWLMPTNEA